MQRTPERLFENVAGPSPWYLKQGKPLIEKFRWQETGTQKGSSCTGKTLLLGDVGLVAILDFYNYAFALNDSTLLIWNQHDLKGKATQPVCFTIVKPDELKPLDGNLEELCRSMEADDCRLLLGSGPLDAFELETSQVEVDINVTFPEKLNHLKDLLLFCKSSAIGLADYWNTMNLALLVAHPKSSTYRLIPQDWFNKGSYDFGYQWPTRVTRDPKTNLVHGEGIRIGSFVLDDSLRNLRNR